MFKLNINKNLILKEIIMFIIITLFVIFSKNTSITTHILSLYFITISYRIGAYFTIQITKKYNFKKLT